MKTLRCSAAVVFLVALLSCHPKPPVAPPPVTAPVAPTTPPPVAASCASCPVSSVDSHASIAFMPADTTGGCMTRMSNGFPLPDPRCTPGAVNPTITLDVLRNTAFRTACIRNCVTTEQEKNAAYGLYAIPHPGNNTGATQSCELDHLVPLELGGADTLDNIWPQCGPDAVTLAARYFKQKDAVENFLTAQVKAGAMNMADAQRGIAMDWTQFLAPASAFCHTNPGVCGASPVPAPTN